METPILQMLTPLIKDNIIYTVNTRGQMQCIDASSGDLFWEERVRGRFNASPVYADGKLCFSSTNSRAPVIKEGKEFKQLAENRLEGEIWTTPAVANHSILIRTSQYLYRIGRTK